ncbi:ThiF family adenylyltransferase [soil metagenome]
MEYTVTFLEVEYERLTHHLFDDATTERAAYLLCRLSRTPLETRLLVRDVITVAAEDVLDASTNHMSVHSRSYLRAMKAANERGEAFVFVHSHPAGYPEHSSQDDVEEKPLFRTAYHRIHADVVHASLVLSEPGRPVGRVWLEDGSVHPVKRIRVVGDRVRIYQESIREAVVPAHLDRQVRAFGRATQLVLGELTVGLVGVGGTGSAVFEELVRLGVGRIIIADPEELDPTNVNRVYGSRLADAGMPKIEIAERTAVDIGAGTIVTAMQQPISFASVLKQFRECDVIFGCTDDEWGRSLLTRFAIFYCIPVFDMGVEIDSESGVITSIQGRVTTLMPTRACLYCRNRISLERVRAETMRAFNPAEAEALRAEGYAPELAEPSPAVIPFTTTVAATAITELLHRLTGFLGSERKSSEVLHIFSQTRVRTNDRAASPDCLCGQQHYWGLGDVEPFLDLIWRPE